MGSLYRGKRKPERQKFRHNGNVDAPTPLRPKGLSLFIKVSVINVND